MYNKKHYLISGPLFTITCQKDPEILPEAAVSDFIVFNSE